MKVIGINGSSRKDGNTAIIIGKVFDELNKEVKNLRNNILNYDEDDKRPAAKEKLKNRKPKTKSNP